jgi:transposase
MKGYDVYAGIDVGKFFHHIYAIDRDGEVLADRRIEQDEGDITRALEALAGRGGTLVVVDQPNNIGALTLACAKRAGCDRAYMPGLAMRRAAGMLPGDAKTDARDARAMAEAAGASPRSLRPAPDRPEGRAQLEALASLDGDLRADRTREVNRLRSALLEAHPAFERALGDTLTSDYVLELLSHFGGPWAIAAAGAEEAAAWLKRSGRRAPAGALEAMLAAMPLMSEPPAAVAALEGAVIPKHAARILDLDSARRDVAGRMEALLGADPACQALMTMPGVGPKTAAALACCVDIGCFEAADQLCSYAGLAPRTRQSGTSIRGESASRSGNKALKSALFLSAFASLRCDQRARDFYDRKRAEGKSHNAAVISLARKRVKVMFAIMKSGEPYRAA